MSTLTTAAARPLGAFALAGPATDCTLVHGTGAP